MEHALHLFALLVVTRLFGELLERLRQPAAIGEILAGVALALVAASALPVPLLADLADSPFLGVAAEFGIFFLLLLAGIEMRPKEIADHSGTSLAVALGGVLVPLALGFALAWIALPESPLKFAQALLIGVALSISAVPVAVGIFMELGLLHTRVGQTVVSAAIFDDVIGLILLAVLTGVIQTGAMPGPAAMAMLLAKVALFFAITVTIGLFVYRRISALVARMRVPAPHFSALIALSLGFAALAEALGMDFILGPFIAGLFFSPETVGRKAYERIKKSVGDVTDGLLAPLFFASIGVRVELGAFAAIPTFLAALIAVAVIGKLLGAGLPARLAGLSRRESLAVGIGMSGRGAVELIIASIALEAGLFALDDPLVENLFSALVIMAVVTTVLTPLGLRRVLGGRSAVGRRVARDDG
ncbi:cation:proton antiporter [Aquibium sp. A9E412]|uniref:cation:proton antiporter n=1 Tax=Aquibium sp. A9E412 TaxID=2976767 RepID=UPI0025B13A37|nr:cation:proton antiporter [Aquibium sp. A9E412]MDN2565597.1 cation:proton antiporter [Aquibium sp. A9E412]